MSKPAARLTDMHTCPMVTPGTPPIPHVGGPILPPCVPNVLVGMLPAATVGDLCFCVGPPDSIAMGSPTVFIGGKMAARMGDMTAHGGVISMGCPTVLIGDGGGGGGGPGGGGGTGLAAVESSWSDDLIGALSGVWESIQDTANSLVEGAEGILSDLKGAAADQIESIKSAHHEEREALNKNLPEYEEATDPDSGWWLLPPEDSIYHDDGKGKPELKYVHEDGREVVYDGDSHQIVTDPRYKGTYNYHRMMPREYYPDGVSGWVEKQQDGLKHVVDDVIPYKLWGNDREAQ